MTRRNALALTTRDFELLDARHLAAALRKHLDVLKPCGLKESELREYHAVIDAADKHNEVLPIDAQAALDEARLECRQRLGEFRRWAEVVARTPTGVDKAAWKTLKLDLGFPNDDGQLQTFLKGLGAAMQKYSAKLTARSFGRDKQQGLLDAWATFQKLGKEVLAQKSSRKAVAGDRSSSFAALRASTRHYRQLGLAAFHGAAGESDFRRLAKGKKAGKVAAGAAAGATKGETLGS